MATYDSEFGNLHDTYLPARAESPVEPGPPKPKPKKQKLRAKEHPPRKVTPTPKDKIPPPSPTPEELGIPDLPPELAAQIANILAAHPGADGITLAIQFIRGTDWFKTTYVGFDAGVQSGLWGANDFAAYRNWRVGIADVFKTSYNRAPTAGELVGYLKQGFTVGTVGQIGQGHAWEAANAPDVQYLLGAFDKGRLSPAELETLGQQEVGRGSTAGAAFQARLQAAAAKMDRLFSGVLAGPTFQLGGAGLSAPSLQTRQKADIGA